MGERLHQASRRDPSDVRDPLVRPAARKDDRRMSKFPDALAEIMKSLEPPKRTVTQKVWDCDDQLDRMSDAFHAEADRWCYRRDGEHFILVRNSSPKNDIMADEYFQITRLTKRE